MKIKGIIEDLKRKKLKIKKMIIVKIYLGIRNFSGAVEGSVGSV